MRTAPPPDSRSFDTILDQPSTTRRESIEEERRQGRRTRRWRPAQQSPLRLTVTAVLALALLGAGVSFAGQKLWGGDHVTIEPAGMHHSRHYATGLEVGVRFTVAAPVVADGVFVYVSDSQVSPSVRVWSADGNLIGTGAQPARSQRGWRKVFLRTAVTLKPATTYVVSYTAASSGVPSSAGVPAPAAPGVTVLGTVTGKGGSMPVRTVAPSAPTVQIGLRASTVTQSPTVSARPSTTPTPTPTPTKSPTRTTHESSPTDDPGSGLPAGTKGCMAKPSSCGYPDASSTGPSSGTTLRAVPGTVSKGAGWHYDSRGYVSVDGNGAVLDGLDIPYNVDVTADNVTIKNSRITVRGESFGISIRHVDNTVITNNEISSPTADDNRLMVGVKDIYADSTRTRVLNNDIWHTATGVQMDAGLIQGNYIHDMGYKDGDHINGTTSNGGTQPLTIKGNTVLNQLQQTDAVSLFQDFGRQANRVIDGNLLAGGGYAVYAGDTPGGSGTTNVKVTNNRFTKVFYAKGGYYGPVTAYDNGGSGNVWSGNVWDDTGAAVSP